MKVDLRDYEYFIIAKGSSYLRGAYAGGKVFRWTYSVYEACAFKSRTLAENVMKGSGGELKKCSRLTGEVWNI